jgi:hydroxypyruvate isomerase
MMDDPNHLGRRAALGGFVAAATALITADSEAAAQGSTSRLGRLKQSVCRWTVDSQGQTPLPDVCRRAKQVGLVAIDLLYPDEWPIAQDAGLTVSMTYPSRNNARGFIATGFNTIANHAALLKELEEVIPLAAKAKVPNVIAMFGNRVPGMEEAEAIDNCIAGLSKIAPLAAESGVTVCVELLNSKVNHKGYQGDHTAFGVSVMKGINSPNVKLLYDIYHMQIMEGDVISTIRDNARWIGHFHTGGVPGRHEINDTQELNYRGIAAAIADLPFSGYVAHEFVPTRTNPFDSLAEAYAICTV